MTERRAFMLYVWLTIAITIPLLVLVQKTYGASAPQIDGTRCDIVILRWLDPPTQPKTNDVVGQVYIEPANGGLLQVADVYFWNKNGSDYRFYAWHRYFGFNTEYRLNAFIYLQHGDSVWIPEEVYTTPCPVPVFAPLVVFVAE